MMGARLIALPHGEQANSLTRRYAAMNLSRCPERLDMRKLAPLLL